VGLMDQGILWLVKIFIAVQFFDFFFIVID